MSAEHGAPPEIAVVDVGETSLTRARATRLAAQLGAPFLENADAAASWFLAVTADRVELRSGSSNAPGPVYAEFVAGAAGYARRRSAPQGLLVRTVKGRLSAPNVIDATAGLGRDAFRLAAAGCQVYAIERRPEIAALFEDGLRRAAEVPALQPVVERIRLTVADARSAIRARQVPADVIYLDPMYPLRKQSALVKKELRALRSVVGDDRDAEQLLAVARRAARLRVVVKRMRTAPCLVESPVRSTRDRTTRYDVYERS